MVSFETILLITSSLLLVTAYLYKDSRAVVCSLFLGSFLLACFFALLDPFLGLWDEQFHALVAKHLAENPLKPLLYKDPMIIETGLVILYGYISSLYFYGKSH